MMSYGKTLTCDKQSCMMNSWKCSVKMEIINHFYHDIIHRKILFLCSSKMKFKNLNKLIIKNNFCLSQIEILNSEINLITSQSRAICLYSSACISESCFCKPDKLIRSANEYELILSSSQRCLFSKSFGFDGCLHSFM